MSRSRWILLLVFSASVLGGLLLWRSYFPTRKNEAPFPGDAAMSREHRAEVKQRYGKLFDDVAAALFAADPIGINFGNNTDEYEPEASTIIPRLHECQSANDVQNVTQEEFVRWFGDAGTADRYEEVVEKIWQLWKTHKR
jgi:hypothetical protein